MAFLYLLVRETFSRRRYSFISERYTSWQRNQTFKRFNILVFLIEQTEENLSKRDERVYDIQRRENKGKWERRMKKAGRRSCGRLQTTMKEHFHVLNKQVCQDQKG
jgi:hypothetical protein